MFSKLTRIFQKTGLNEKMDVAIFWKDNDEVEKLLNRGADPNGRGLRQIHLGKAIECRNEAAIELLLDAGADPRQPLRHMGFELSMVEGAETFRLSSSIIDRLKAAEREAIENWGPGPKLRRPPTGGCCFPSP